MLYNFTDSSFRYNNERYGPSKSTWLDALVNIRDMISLMFVIETRRMKKLFSLLSYLIDNSLEHPLYDVIGELSSDAQIVKPTNVKDILEIEEIEVGDLVPGSLVQLTHYINWMRVITQDFDTKKYVASVKDLDSMIAEHKRYIKIFEKKDMTSMKNYYSYILTLYT